MEVKAHDLLQLSSFSSLISHFPIPEWVHASLERANWVVVRRESISGGLIPIGVRGSLRSERFAAYLPEKAVVGKVEPEQLAAERGWQFSTLSSIGRLMKALDELHGFYSSLGLCWGPTGSIGFELASKVRAARSESDIDIVIRADRPINSELARHIVRYHENFPCHIDAQMETPFGAVALAEFARGAGSMLLKTNSGPKLVTDPWKVK